VNYLAQRQTDRQTDTVVTIPTQPEARR